MPPSADLSGVYRFFVSLHVKSQFSVCTSFCEVSGALPYFNSSLAALVALQAAFIFAVCFAIPALKIDSEPFSTVY